MQNYIFFCCISNDSFLHLNCFSEAMRRTNINYFTFPLFSDKLLGSLMGYPVKATPPFFIVPQILNRWHGRKRRKSSYFCVIWLFCTFAIFHLCALCFVCLLLEDTILIWSHYQKIYFYHVFQTKYFLEYFIKCF